MSTAATDRTADRLSPDVIYISKRERERERERTADSRLATFNMSAQGNRMQRKRRSVPTAATGRTAD